MSTRLRQKKSPLKGQPTLRLGPESVHMDSDCARRYFGRSWVYISAADEPRPLNDPDASTRCPSRSRQCRRSVRASACACCGRLGSDRAKCCYDLRDSLGKTDAV